MSSYRENDRNAREYQRKLAIPKYAEYWGVDEDKIVENDELNARGDSLARLLDTNTGIDKIIELRSNLTLAQRLRDPGDRERDFTIRRRPDGRYDAEYSKLTHSYEENLTIPDRYAYGQVSQSEYKLRFLRIVDLRKFLKCELEGSLEKIPAPDSHDAFRDSYCWQNSKGRQDNGFYAWSWKELHKRNIIIAELHDGGSLEKVTTQSGLGDFND